MLALRVHEVSVHPSYRIAFLISYSSFSTVQISTSGLTGAGMFSDAVVARQLLSVLDEDFIELNDLVP